MKTIDGNGNPIDMTDEQKISVYWRGVYAHCKNISSILEDGTIPPKDQEKRNILLMLGYLQTMLEKLNELGALE